MTKEKELKTKNNAWFMLCVIALICIIICTSAFGISAWARYKSATQGTATAQVAKWSFKVNGQTENFGEIDLTETLSYNHVASKRIAPGTDGAFDLIIDGSGSEVAIEYFIDLDVKQKPTNMKFYSDSEYTTELEINENNIIEITNQIMLENINTPVTNRIYWKWEYNTEEMPTDEALSKHGIDKMQLVEEYNAASTEEEKKQVLIKVNDMIDTKENGMEVVLPIVVRGMQIGKETINASNWYKMGDTSMIFDKANQLLGTAGGRSYYKLNDGPAIAYLQIINGGPHYVLISPIKEATYGWCTYNSSNINTSRVAIVEAYNITWYITTIEYAFLSMESYSPQCYDVGKVGSKEEAAMMVLQKYFEQ